MIDHTLAGRLNLLGISGSRASPSKTKVAVRTALDFVAGAHCDVHTDLIGLDEYWLDPCDGRDPPLYRDTTREVIDRVASADALIVASPIYRGSYPGVLKNLFDLIPSDALEGKVVGLIATGGTSHHFLAIEHELKPLLGFFRAFIAPHTVYAHDGQFANGALADQTIVDRLHQLAQTVVDYARRFQGADKHQSPRGPRRRANRGPQAQTTAAPEPDSPTQRLIGPAPRPKSDLRTRDTASTKR